jgi:hypothetical protein
MPTLFIAKVVQREFGFVANFSEYEAGVHVSDAFDAGDFV